MATKANLNIDQGTDFITEVNLTYANGSPQDLTGYVGASKVKKHPDASTSYVLEVDIDALNGKITISANNTVTSSIPWGRYRYDVELTNNNTSPPTISRIMEGIFTVNPEITS